MLSYLVLSIWSAPFCSSADPSSMQGHKALRLPCNKVGFLPRKVLLLLQSQIGVPAFLQVPHKHIKSHRTGSFHWVSSSWPLSGMMSSGPWVVFSAALCFPACYAHGTYVYPLCPIPFFFFTDFFLYICILGSVLIWWLLFVYYFSNYNVENQYTHV